MHVCSVTSIISDAATLWIVANQASLSMGFSRQEYWSGLPCPAPGIEPPGVEPMSPALQVASLPTEPPQFSCLVMSDSEAPWTRACQASLSITNSWSLVKLMSIMLVMPSNHLILCHLLLLLPSIFPSIRIFSNESILHIKVAKVLEFQNQSF